MGESENIIVRGRIRGVSGADEGRYRIAGDNGEECESKRRLKGGRSRTDEITWRLWRQVEKECVAVRLAENRTKERRRKRSRRGK